MDGYFSPPFSYILLSRKVIKVGGENMFCHKCGAKMPDESTFCFKCGTKLISEDISNPIEAIDTEAETVSLKKSTDSEVQQPIQTPTPESSHTEQNNDDAEFRRFVNKRVQEMTKCKTAEELMKKHPMRIPMILCYGLCLLLGLSLSNGSNYIGISIGCILFCLAVGFLISYLIGWIRMLRYLFKHRKNLGGEINGLDMDNLILFLNNKLAYLKPQMGNWGYFSMIFAEGANDAANLLTNYLENKDRGSIRLGSQCSKWYSPFSIIALRSDNERPDVTKYEIISGNTSAGSYNMSVFSCMYRTAPIISAAMEYYRENQQTIMNEYGSETLKEKNILYINSKYSFLVKHVKLIAVVFAIILGIITIADINSKAYIKEISDVVPTAMEDEGMKYTFGQVFDRYIESQKWEKDGSGDHYIVYLNGRFKSSEKNVRITFEISKSKEYTETQLSEMEIDGIKSSSMEETVYYVACMFDAYDENLTPAEYCEQVLDVGFSSEVINDTVENTEEIVTSAQKDLESMMENTDDNVTAETVQELSSENEDNMIRSAYVEKVRELADEDGDMTFSLIDLTADDVYELVADKSGYYVNIYAYDNGFVVPIIEEWGYGAGGNQGYEYLPGKNIIRNTSLGGAGREMYTTYMCVDSEHKVQYAYDDVLCNIYPSSYYYGEREISEYEYSNYQIAGDYSIITGIMGAAQMTAQLSEGINIRSSNDGEMTFNGVPVSSFIGVPIYSITYLWGEPSEYIDRDYENVFTYDGIEFVYNHAGKVEQVRMDPMYCSFNSNTLDKNRDSLESLLGAPSYEGWEADYCMCYKDLSYDYSLYIDMNSPEESPFAIRLEIGY